MRLHEMSQKICDFLLIQGLTYHRWTFCSILSIRLLYIEAIYFSTMTFSISRALIGLSMFRAV